MTFILDNTHSIFSLKPAVQRAVGPFLEEMGLNYFQYLRCFSDGSIGLLTNNTSLVELFHQAGKVPFVYSSFKKEDEYLSSYWFLWDEALPLQPVKMVREVCGIKHGITLVKRYKNYYDMLAVAVPHYVQPGFYLNKLNRIENFFHQFEKNNKVMIDSMNGNPLILAVENRDVNHESLCLKDKKIIIGSPFGESYLTTQEWLCLDLLHGGLSYKEVASKLKISPRTIETYLQRVRQRTGISSAKDLQHFIKSVR